MKKYRGGGECVSIAQPLWSFTMVIFVLAFFVDKHKVEFMNFVFFFNKKMYVNFHFSFSKTGHFTFSHDFKDYRIKD